MKRWLPCLALAGAAAYGGLCAFAFHEVFHRDAGLPGKINESAKQKSGQRGGPPDPRVQWLKAQPFEVWHLKSADGLTLTAHYLPSDTESDRFVVCAHGYRNQGKGEFRFITKYYHEQGFHVLLVDHRASGDSEGTLITFGKKESEDLLLWLSEVRRRAGENVKIMLHGISMGAATVLLLSDSDALPEEVCAIVADCGFTDVIGQFAGVLQGAHVPPQPLVFGVDLIHRARSGFSLKTLSPLNAVKNAKVPILFVHGKKDSFVKPHMAKELYDACPTQKRLLLVDGAGHASSYQTDPAAYEAALEQFIFPFLQDKQPELKGDD